jgi:hypothetical protein
MYICRRSVASSSEINLDLKTVQSGQGIKVQCDQIWRNFVKKIGYHHLNKCEIFVIFCDSSILSKETIGSVG